MKELTYDEYQRLLRERKIDMVKMLYENDFGTCAEIALDVGMTESEVRSIVNKNK
jgi:predicted DNA-binding protein YlxM (UPF0122 family)